MRVVEFTIINKIFNNLQKLVAVFVLSFILLNAFVPKNVELKNSFISALNCAVNTVQTNFYDQYSNIVMSVINSILSNLNVAELAGTQAIQAQTQKKENNKQVPVNTSSDNAILITNNINNQSSLNILKANLSYLVYETTNKLYNICESIKTSSSKETSTMGILFFILFSILVIRIKDTIAVLNNKIIVRKPTWLLV